MAITSLHDVWVTANFKETQLRSMAAGQRAEIEVDAYGGRRYAGRVESIAAATGATFSLLPADNSSGNFVKVVQRVPVKIVLETAGDASAVLRPGMSVNATVFLR
jgi:membrane fusion protein (multidrug efflux system)